MPVFKFRKGNLVNIASKYCSEIEGTQIRCIVFVMTYNSCFVGNSTSSVPLRQKTIQQIKYKPYHIPHINLVLLWFYNSSKLFNSKNSRMFAFISSIINGCNR